MGDEWRKSYQEKWKVYDIFSRREDFQDLAWKTFQEMVDLNGKTVFEMGCGTGKYTKKIATLAKKIYANDISKVMIEQAKKACSSFQNITYICESAHKSGLPEHSVDIIFSAWGYVAGDSELALNVEKEFERILKPGGEVWLLDNYYEGQFTMLRGKKVLSDESKYPEEKYGYLLKKVIPTNFLFDSIEEAADVFGFLFGQTARDTIIRDGLIKIEDNIALMKKTYDERTI